MRYRSHWGLALLAVLALLVTACGGRPAQATVQAVKIDPIEGSSFKRLTLTEQAVKRTGIEVAPVREEQVTRRRLMGGEIITPGGQSVVRLRLSVSDYEVVDPTQPVRVQPASAQAVTSARSAMAQPMPQQPVQLPGPAAATGPGAAAAALLSIPVDWSLPGTDHGFAAAEKVLVETPMKGGGMRKVVPYSSLIYELDGRTWVYTNPEGTAYVRAPVTVDWVEGDRAILSDGPSAGTRVVSVGASQLYGAEYRTGK